MLAPREEPAEDFLRLMLNALHFLGNGQRAPAWSKAVTELRMLSLAGFMPDLLACARPAARSEGEAMWFFPREGTLACGPCHAAGRLSGGLPMPGNVLAAMRHIVFPRLKAAFLSPWRTKGWNSFPGRRRAFCSPN